MFIPQRHFTAHNDREFAVLHSISYHAARYPTVAADEKLVTNVAWAAMDQLPKQCRGGEAVHEDKAIDRAVLAAYDRVYAQSALSTCKLVHNLHSQIECEEPA